VTASLSHQKTGFAPTLPRCTARRNRRGSGVGSLALSATSAVGVTRLRMRRPVTDGEIGGNIWNAERSLRSRHLSLDLDAFTHWARSRSRQAQGASSGL